MVRCVSPCFELEPSALFARCGAALLWGFVTGCGGGQEPATGASAGAQATATTTMTASATPTPMQQTKPNANAQAGSTAGAGAGPAAKPTVSGGPSGGANAASAAGSMAATPTATGSAGTAGGPMSAAAGSGMAANAGAQAAAGAAGAMPASAGPLTLMAVDVEDVGDGFVAFPETARPPTNQSPGFRWTGVPAEAKSLALVFRDVSSPTPPVKWVLWNMPPDRTEVPANVSGSAAMPMQVPGASQLGSLGNQGYAGPCCVGNEYEWIIYALDVAELPDVARMSTAQINMNVLPMHTLEKSKPVMMRIKD